jgi:hypothetical protein
MNKTFIGLISATAILNGHGLKVAASVDDNHLSSHDSTSSTTTSLLRRQLVPEQDHQQPPQKQGRRSLDSEEVVQEEEQLDERMLESLECIPHGITDFDSCSAFCNATTSSSWNTFIALDAPVMRLDGTVNHAYCCACFSGPVYCADGIPECASYSNLDPDGAYQSLKLDNFSVPPDFMNSMMKAKNASLSCLDDMNVTDSSSCADFCTARTGLSDHSFNSHPEQDEYYCFCTTMVNGENVFCNDNIDDLDMNISATTTTLHEKDDSLLSAIQVRDRMDPGGRSLNAEGSEMPTCKDERVSDYVSCEQFCLSNTGHAQSTFSTMITPIDEEENHCCACVHSDFFCSDNVPSCGSYSNLRALEDESDEGSTMEDQTDEDPSCIALDITSTLACGNFCMISTGQRDHSFGSTIFDQYYCVCDQPVLSTKQLGNSDTFSPRPRSITSTVTSTTSSNFKSLDQKIFCSDNMEDGWKVFFLNQDQSSPSSANSEQQVSSAPSIVTRDFLVHGLISVGFGAFISLVF